jgi:protein SCO1/2
MKPILFLAAISIAIGGLSGASPGWTHEGHDHGAAAQRGKKAVSEPRAQPRTEAQQSKYTRSLRVYVVPDVTLTNADARRVELRNLLATDNAVMLDFVSTKCSTTCPETGKAFSAVPKMLGPQAPKLRMISFFVDPEHDTPAALKAYARELGARANWHFLTGTAEEIETVRRAFGNDRGGDKSSVEPLTLVRHAPGEPWLRIEGTATAGELVREYRELMRK